MTGNSSAHRNYDARVGFFPRRGTPAGIYALVKLTYDTRETPCLADAIPLSRDLLDPTAEPTLELGTDSWLDKRHTDVVVLGSAWAREPVTRMQVSVTVGEIERRIAVFGRRTASIQDRRIRFSDPEPFTELAVRWNHAYGGIDTRVEASPPDSPEELDHLHLRRDLPGLYPRNPFGKGYIVIEPRPGEEVELPNLEDPDDLLTTERLVTGDPSRWWVQPLPSTFDYAPHGVFTRYVYLGGDAWFSPPDDGALAEVRRGILPAGFRKFFPPGIDPGFYQEAAPGLVLPRPASDTPLNVRGMHPGGKVVRAHVPRPPPVEIELDGRRQAPELHLSKIVLLPAKEKLVLTWMAKTSDMHRIYVPGLHAKIPLFLRVGADAPIPYVAPPTVRQQLLDAKNRGVDLTPPRPMAKRTRRG